MAGSRCQLLAEGSARFVSWDTLILLHEASPHDLCFSQPSHQGPDRASLAPQADVTDAKWGHLCLTVWAATSHRASQDEGEWKLTLPFNRRSGKAFAASLIPRVSSLIKITYISPTCKVHVPLLKHPEFSSYMNEFLSCSGLRYRIQIKDFII